LVERSLPKAQVEGSSPFARFISQESEDAMFTETEEAMKAMEADNGLPEAYLLSSVLSFLENHLRKSWTMRRLALAVKKEGSYDIVLQRIEKLLGKDNGFKMQGPCCFIAAYLFMLRRVDRKVAEKAAALVIEHGRTLIWSVNIAYEILDPFHPEAKKSFGGGSVLMLEDKDGKIEVIDLAFAHRSDQLDEVLQLVNARGGADAFKRIKRYDVETSWEYHPGTIKQEMDTLW
jgi:hypothetical protein